MGFISLPMKVDTEIADISAPESLVTLIKAKGMRGMVCLNRKSTYKLTKVVEGKTKITCELEEEGFFGKS